MGSKWMKFFLFAWGSVASLGLYVSLGDLPMQNPDLFGGDMVGVDDPGERNAVVDSRMLWPEGVVPYEVDPARSVSLLLLRSAFCMYQKDTCIKFVERTNERDFIRIIGGQGCYSHVGRTGGMQPVSLGTGCDWMGTVIHELGHALGFYHEQNRSDRDAYLTIYWENIQDVFLGDLPMQNPDLFGGDILGIDESWDRNAVVDKRQVWPGGVVPYEIDPSLSTYESQLLGAFYLYKKDTCIRFVKRTNETDYIRIFKGQGCYSHVGKTGGSQPVSLGTGCNWMGIVVHELAHALGFYHEQNRSDRDDYLIIYWDNIVEGMADQFMKLKPSQNQLLDSFDYESILLYDEYAFSKAPKELKTMARKNDDKPLREVWVKYSLSKSDILRINKLYQC